MKKPNKALTERVNARRSALTFGTEEFMSYKCPKCNGVIYNRRSNICGFCGAELPAEFLFTAEKIVALDRDAAEAEARRKRKEEADAEAEEEMNRARTLPPELFSS